MHKLNVKEKYYYLLKSGKKTIELRLNDEKRKNIHIGDFIEFVNNSDTGDKFIAEVTNIYRARDFVTLCDDIDCNKAGFSNNEELQAALKKFYPVERQEAFGVVGIEIRRHF